MTIRPAATSLRISSGCKLLALGDEFHFRRDLAGAGMFELRNRFRHRYSSLLRDRSQAETVQRLRSGMRRINDTSGNFVSIVSLWRPVSTNGRLPYAIASHLPPRHNSYQSA